MPPAYAATGLSVNSTIAYPSAEGVFPLPFPGVALATPASNAPKTNIIPMATVLTTIRWFDMIRASSEWRGPHDLASVRKSDVRQKGCAECSVVPLPDNNGLWFRRLVFDHAVDLHDNARRPVVWRGGETHIWVTAREDDVSQCAENTPRIFVVARPFVGPSPPAFRR